MSDTINGDFAHDSDGKPVYFAPTTVLETLNAYIVAHARANIYMGRGGELRQFPLFFEQRSHAEECRRDGAQVCVDWLVVPCQITFTR